MPWFSTIYGWTITETTSANEMNFDMKHAPGTGSITPPVDLQSNTIPLCCGWPLYLVKKWSGGAYSFLLPGEIYNTWRQSSLMNIWDINILRKTDTSLYNIHIYIGLQNMYRHNSLWPSVCINTLLIHYWDKTLHTAAIFVHIVYCSWGINVNT